MVLTVLLRDLANKNNIQVTLIQLTVALERRFTPLLWWKNKDACMTTVVSSCAAYMIFYAIGKAQQAVYLIRS
jgi:hypothetical protein